VTYVSAIDLSRAKWRASSYSSGNGQCIEVAGDFPGIVPVRDSKNPEGQALTVPADGWAAFVNAVKRRELSA
jgi:hypothetical protein